MRRALLTVTAIVVAASVHAQTVEDIPQVLLQHIRREMPIERYIADILDLIRDVDIRRDGLDAEDIERTRQKSAAQNRANRLQAFFKFDLNNDLQVTREEIKDREDGSRELFKYDANSDGIVSFDEMRNGPDNPPEDGQPDLQRVPLYGDGPDGNSRDDLLLGLLELDPNKDGKLTLAEAETLAREAFAKVSTDGNDIISSEEYAASGAAASRPRNTCRLPPPDAGEKVVVYGLYEGDTQSDVHLGNPEDETYIIDVEIEKDTGPLYIVLTSYSTAIFRFTGATDQVSKLVFATSPRGRRSNGAIGLPADKIVWAACDTYFYKPGSPEATQSLGLIKAALKKEPDFFAGSYTTNRLTLPSGTMLPPAKERIAAPDGFDPRVWDGALRFDPGGIALIDPAVIISRGKPRKYDVLPGWFGLAKLAGEGALQQVDDRARSGFRILKPFPVYPPGLAGAHSVKFLLPKDMAEPGGSLAHSCLIYEETGKVKGATCGQ